MDTETSVSFGTLLYERRISVGLTQEGLAERAGISARTIRLLEQGGSTPQRATAQCLASALGVSAEEIERFLAAATPGPRRSTSSQEHAHAPSAWPVPPTGLVGRAAEVATVLALLEQTEIRVLTLTGPGGIGKTRLALQVGDALRDSYTDGAVFVPLDPLSDPDLVVSAIAQTLDVREGGERPLGAQLEAYLRDKHLLLLLDNFEHVVAAAPLVAGLLASCPRLKVLVTSRVVLHLRGEHEFPVPPLVLPDVQQLPELEALGQIEAIALFLQRVQAAKPDFQLNQANAQVITEICVRLEGLPLALELAAARIKVLSPTALLLRLDRRLQLLTGGAQDLPPRQQTLRNAIAWSYDLLTTSEQRLFEQLAVFAGGCTLEAAEAVGKGAEQVEFGVLDGLQSLVDKSLVRRVEQFGGDVRFMMLETIRAYALEQLEAHGHTEAAYGEHAAYYLWLAQAAEPQIYGADQLVWLEQLEAEHDNLRGALRRFIDAHKAQAALCLSGTLVRFWFMRGYLSEGRRWLDEALQINAGCERNTVWAKACTGAGVLAYYQGDTGRATTLCGESLRLSRQLGDQPGIVAALHGLALVAREGDNTVAARAMYEESVHILRALHDTWGLAHTLNYLGLLLLQDDPTRARVLIAEGLGLFREVGDRWGIALSLSGLSSVTTLEGKFAEARPLVEEAIAVFKTVGDKRGMSRPLWLLAEIARNEGQYTMARSLYVEALAILCALGERSLTPTCLDGLAAVVTAQGHQVEAARLFAVATTLRDASGVPTPAPLRAQREENLAHTRALLSEAQFTAAWQEGQTMAPEQVVAQFGSKLPKQLARDPYVDVDAPALHDLARLTKREVEVLHLVAQGMTDAQVAARLIVSPRTINFHLSSIYSKLGVNSRTAASHYAHDHNLFESRPPT